MVQLLRRQPITDASDASGLSDMAVLRRQPIADASDAPGLFKNVVLQPQPVANTSDAPGLSDMAVLRRQPVADAPGAPDLSGSVELRQQSTPDTSDASGLSEMVALPGQPIALFRSVDMETHRSHPGFGMSVPAPTSVAPKTYSTPDAAQGRDQLCNLCTARHGPGMVCVSRGHCIKLALFKQNPSFLDPIQVPDTGDIRTHDKFPVYIGHSAFPGRKCSSASIETLNLNGGIVLIKWVPRQLGHGEILVEGQPFPIKVLLHKDHGLYATAKVPFGWTTVFL